MPAAYYVVSILVSLCGCMFFYLTPLGILTAGLWSRDRNWWIHFTIAMIAVTFLPQLLSIIAGLTYEIRDIDEISERGLLRMFANMDAPFGFLYSLVYLIAAEKGPDWPLILAFIFNFLGFVYALIYIILSGRSTSASQFPTGGPGVPPYGYPVSPEYPTSPPPPPRS